MPEFAQLGASMMILNVHETLGSEDLHKISRLEEPFLIFCDDDVTGTIVSYLKLANAAGVILTAPGEEAGNCMRRKQELKAPGDPGGYLRIVGGMEPF